MKKTIWIISGLVFLYFGIYLFLGVTSSNIALKNNNFINKAIASIKVFENSWNNTEYYTWSNDLVDDKWSSSSYPNWSYSKVSVVNLGNWDPEPITTQLQNIVRNVSRHSH